MPERPLWTITALTIPEREPYLKKLLTSIDATPLDAPAEVLIVYNTDVREGYYDIEERIRGCSKLPLTVLFNGGDACIASGRALQLNSCKTPLVCFVDDDVTLHGDVFPALAAALRAYPLGLVGVRSYVEDTLSLFKPRAELPFVERGGMHYMQVQGMLAAGYANLLREVGGFNPRRRFWGEWTELNLRLWRSGFPTGYQLDAGYLRHWEQAPNSPTRSLDGRERHVLWGLMCTALEYDAVDITEATATFWRLVENRYLAYSFGDDLSFKNLLKTTLELMPQLSSEWGHIQAFRETTLAHPFSFMPFHPLTDDDVKRVVAHAAKRIRPYRETAFTTRTPVRRVAGAVLTRAVGGRMARVQDAMTRASAAMRRWAHR
jgi:hypothetical protein